MDEPFDADTSSGQWRQLFRRCSSTNVTGSSMIKLARDLRQHVPLRGQLIYRALLDNESLAYIVTSPAIYNMTATLLQSRFLQPYHVLQALLNWQAVANGDDHGYTHPKVDSDAKKIHGARITQKVLTTVLASLGSVHDIVEDVFQCKRLLRVAQSFMSVINAEAKSDEADEFDELFTQPPEAILSKRQAVGLLVFGILTQQKVSKVLRMGLPENFQKLFSMTLSGFVAMLSTSCPNIASQIDLLQKSTPTLNVAPVTGSESINGHDEQVGQIRVNSIQSVPNVWSRAGNLIFVDAALHAKPILTDALVLQYLEKRFQNNVPEFCLQFVTAAFDTILVAQHASTTEDQQRFALKSFLVNRVPAILSQLQNRVQIFTDFPLDISIRQAVTTVKTSLVSTQGLFSSAQASSASSAASELCESFLKACVLHNLLSKENADSTNGGALSLGMTSKLLHTDLISDCQRNANNIANIITILSSLDGNAMEAATAILQLYQQYCAVKDMHSLHLLCQKLSFNLQALDSISVIYDMTAVVIPVCRILDNWTVDEEQGEKQTGYEEFSAILLFVLTCVHRYDLQIAEIIEEPVSESFVGKFLRGQFPRVVGRLSQQQQQILTAWFKALFESESIDNALLSICPPQEFISLVPCLLTQCVQAGSASTLDIDRLRSGLELFLEPFLLPTLVLGIPSVHSFAWQSARHAEVYLAITNKLLQPPSLSGDAISTHSLFMSMVKQPLIQTLLDINKRLPNRGEIDALIDRMQAAPDISRAISNNVPSSASTMHTSNLTSRMREQFRQLNFWSQTVTAPLPGFSFGGFAHHIASEGCKSIVDEILTEVKAQTEAGIAAVSVDIAASLILAYDVRDNQRSDGDSLRLLDVLQSQCLEAPKTIITSPAKTEAAVRVLAAVTGQRLTQPKASLPLIIAPETAAEDISNALNVVATTEAMAPSKPNEPAAMDFASSGAEIEMNLNTSANESNVVDEGDMSAGNNNGMDDMEGIDPFADLGDFGASFGNDFSSMFNDY